MFVAVLFSIKIEALIIKVVCITVLLKCILLVKFVLPSFKSFKCASEIV